MLMVPESPVVTGNTPRLTELLHSGIGICCQHRACSLLNGLLGAWLMASLQLQGSLLGLWKIPGLLKYGSSAPACLLQADGVGWRRPGSGWQQRDLVTE